MRNLGVVFDKNLNMRAQVNTICRSAYFHLRNISRVRSVLSQEATEKLIHALVMSRVDCCNALLCGVSHSLTNKLQRILNTAARILTQTPKSVSMTLVCRDLHWLPVSARVDYKILVLTYKALHGLAPQYLSCLLQWYQPGRSLRSVHSGQLSVPRTKLCTYGDRAFLHAAPVLWNSLPPGTRGAESLAVFKTKLKTFLFCKSF